eukprot:Rmarinus@m.3724
MAPVEPTVKDLEKHQSFIDALCEKHLHLQKKETELLEFSDALSKKEASLLDAQSQFEDRMRSETASAAAEFEEERARLAKLEESFELEKAKMKKYESAIKNGRVKLNVGGTTFDTTVETLTMRSLFFQSMFSGRYMDPQDDAGIIFIDRSGELFSYVLQFLRTGFLSDPGSNVLHALELEAQFFLIEELSTWIQERLSANRTEQNSPASSLGAPLLQFICNNMEVSCPYGYGGRHTLSIRSV